MEYISDTAAMEAIYGSADERVGVRGPRHVDRIDDDQRAFLAAATLVVIATIDHGGLTCSPRGGSAGSLAHVADDSTMWVPDGGGRIHRTVRNLLGDPRVGLLFLVPARQQVLRVQGTARLSADPMALAAFPQLDPPVRAVVVVDVQSVRLSGTGPLTRASLWGEPISG